MKIFFLIPALFLSTSAFAAKVAQPKCSELKTISDKFTPEYLAVVDGYNHAGQQTSTMVDVGGLVTQSANVKERCDLKKTPSTDYSLEKALKETSNTRTGALPTDMKLSVIDPQTAKCQDFLALRDEYQPVAAFWVAGHAKANKVQDGRVDDAFFSRPTLSLIEDCKAQPTASFYDTAKTWLNKTL